MLSRLTWAEVDVRRPLVIPIGSTEQHGCHLPLETDTVQAEQLARWLCKKFNFILAPSVQFGCCDEFISYPGTLSLRPATFKMLLGDLLRALETQGFRRVLLLNAHTGNTPHLVKSYPPLDVLVFNIWQAISGRIRTIEARGEHADEEETSLMMAISPAAVRGRQLHRRNKRAGCIGNPRSASRAKGLELRRLAQQELEAAVIARWKKVNEH